MQLVGPDLCAWGDRESVIARLRESLKEEWLIKGGINVTMEKTIKESFRKVWLLLFSLYRIDLKDFCSI